MARTVETELVDTREIVQPREVPERDSAEKHESEKRVSESKAPSRRLSRLILLAVFAIAVAGASRWWVHSLNYESTDDAQIEGHLDLVSARISGTVTYINPRVENNQRVEEGTLLMELDPRDYAAEWEH